MKKHRVIRAGLALWIAALAAALPARVSAETCHAVEERSVVLYSGDSVKRIPVDGRIIRSAAAASGLYFCAAREGNGGGLSLGFVSFETGEVLHNRDLPVQAVGSGIMKMMAGDGAVYLLVARPEEPGAAGELIRVPDGGGQISRVDGILDFYSAGTDCFLIVKTDRGPRLVLNESSVPLSLKGEGGFRIREVLDRRLVLVTAGDETEVIDIRAGKSLHQYTADDAFLAPDSYNMIIQAVDIDEQEADDREMIFYKLIINGVDAGRTDSGPSALARELKIMLEPNRYHLVRLERWILNSSKGRYDRVNNIRQPKMQQIYIPMNRIVKLVITFNGREYSYAIAPVYK